MPSTLHRFRSDRRAPSWPTRLAALAALLGAAQCKPDYATVAPFRCTAIDDASVAPCPSGYDCVSNACIRHGVLVPINLSRNLDDGDSTFSIHPRASDMVVCWNQPIDDRMPGVFGATFAYGAAGTPSPGPTRVLVGAGGRVPVARYSLFGIAGDCATHNGDTIAAINAVQSLESLTAIATVSGFDAYDSSDSSPPSPPLNNCTAAPLTSHFTSTALARMRSGDVVVNGAEQTWFLVPNIPALNMPDVYPALVYIDYSSGAPTLCSINLKLTPYSTRDLIQSMEVHAGAHGVWAQVLLSGGRSDFWWLDPETPAIANPTATNMEIRPPVDVAAHVPAYLHARVLAVHPGDRFDEAILAFQIDTTHWQTWRVTSGNDVPSADDPNHTPSVWTQGPSFTASDSVVEPGGFVDADDRLLVAVTTDDPSKIVVLAAPRTATPADSFAVAGTIPKLSHVSARRLALTRVSGRLTAVWTELVSPDPQTGMVQYTAIYVDGVPEANP